MNMNTVCGILVSLYANHCYIPRIDIGRDSRPIITVGVEDGYQMCRISERKMLQKLPTAELAISFLRSYLRDSVDYRWGVVYKLPPFGEILQAWGIDDADIPELEELIQIIQTVLSDEFGKAFGKE